MIIYIFHQILDNLKFCRTLVAVGHCGVLHTSTTAVDVEDNDCDGWIDEETDNGIGTRYFTLHDLCYLFMSCVVI